MPVTQAIATCHLNKRVLDTYMYYNQLPGIFVFLF